MELWEACHERLGGERMCCCQVSKESCKANRQEQMSWKHVRYGDYYYPYFTDEETKPERIIHAF